jgi:virulence-associated protein VagC
MTNKKFQCDDDYILEKIGEMNKATQKAENAIDDVLAFVEESNKRIMEMENSSQPTSWDSWFDSPPVENDFMENRDQTPLQIPESLDD